MSYRCYWRTCANYTNQCLLASHEVFQRKERHILTIFRSERIYKRKKWKYCLGWVGRLHGDWRNLTLKLVEILRSARWYVFFLLFYHTYLSGFYQQDWLQKEFGPKAGKNLYNYCRGIDDRSLKFFLVMIAISLQNEISHFLKATQVTWC